MKNLVLNYFNQTALVSNAEEAVNFVNSLKFRGNSYPLVCNDYCKNFFNNYFNGTVEIKSELATTNCSTTRINVYSAMAKTLEAHNIIVAENKVKAEFEKQQKAEKAEKAALADMYHQEKGWYVVTLDVLVSKIKGNDGVKTYSFKILADSKMQAYESTISKIMNEGVTDKNVSFVYEVKDSWRSALIEFVGTWTDESTFEYGEEK